LTNYTGDEWKYWSIIEDYWRLLEITANCEFKESPLPACTITDSQLDQHRESTCLCTDPHAQTDHQLPVMAKVELLVRLPVK